VSDISHDSNSRFSAPIDLTEVRRLFARPGRIAESNFLRREIAGRMRERLELVKINPQSILDAGCGEGEDLAEMRESFPASNLIALDASWEMLQAGRVRETEMRTSMHRLLTKWFPRRAGASNKLGGRAICGDFANLPLASNSVDLIWSNLALHWHPQPDRVFSEWRRVLKVDGLLMFSCFGPDTLKELRTAFDRTGKGTAHILPFVDMHDFGDMLVQAGFSTPVMDMETITVTYESLDKLITDVRGLGGNPLATKSRGLLGRHLWSQIKAEIEHNRSGGKLPLTFEIIYGHAFSPVAKKTAAGESIIRLDFPKK
jgi:malonyl-CoA O-methyltransferase